MNIDCQADFNRLPGQPWEGGVVQWRVSQLGQQLTRLRAGDNEAPAGGSDVTQAHRTVSRQLLAQVVTIVPFSGSRTDDVILLISNFRDSELGPDSASASGEGVA